MYGEGDVIVQGGRETVRLRKQSVTNDASRTIPPEISSNLQVDAELGKLYFIRHRNLSLNNGFDDRPRNYSVDSGMSYIGSVMKNNLLSNCAE